MPHPLTPLAINEVRKDPSKPITTLTADVCVVGAGISGLSAAWELAGLGRDVLLVDAWPTLGGQCVNSLIGLFCGVFGNAPTYHQLTHGIFDDIFADLAATQDLHFSEGETVVVPYDELAMGRWAERMVLDRGIRPLLGASIQSVSTADGRIEAVDLVTRYGSVRVEARGFIDATGDAALTWEAGFACRVPERPIYGSQQIRLENLDKTQAPEPAELANRVHAKADQYGLIRKDGLAFFFPGRNTAVMNMTHVQAPLDPVQASITQLEGKAQADKVVEFLRQEFPGTFGNAAVRSYGLPGRRQTRWISSLHPLTLDEVRNGTTFDDAVARTSWPIELHDRADGYVWEPFGSDHVHYVPLRSLIPAGSVNLVAAGRCVDGDAAALSSIRVMGPCAAMGAGAAHALDLVGEGPVAGVDLQILRSRLFANVEK